MEGQEIVLPYPNLSYATLSQSVLRDRRSPNFETLFALSRGALSESQNGVVMSSRRVYS